MVIYLFSLISISFTHLLILFIQRDKRHCLGLTLGEFVLQHEVIHGVKLNFKICSQQLVILAWHVNNSHLAVCLHLKGVVGNIRK